MNYFSEHIGTVEKREPVETISLQNILTSAGDYVLSAEKRCYKTGRYFYINI